MTVLNATVRLSGSQTVSHGRRSRGSSSSESAIGAEPAGRSSGPTSTRSPLPSIAIARSSKRSRPVGAGGSSRRKSSHRPSGENSGAESAGPAVSGRSGSSPSMIHSLPSRGKATNVPLGAEVGSGGVVGVAVGSDVGTGVALASGAGRVGSSASSAGEVG